jgi:hypothetical protein
MVKPLTNFDLDYIFKDWKDYGGCFSAHSKIKWKNGCFYILNLDPPQNEGSHWVLLDLTDKNTNMYYDSYSVYPPKEIENYL